MDSLPNELVTQLRPAFPRQRQLLHVLVADPRESLAIDDILIRLYLLTSEVQKRSTVTQQLYEALGFGLVARVARGRYAVTPAGRCRLVELTG